MTMTNEEVLARMNAFMPPTAHLLGQEIIAVDQEAGSVRIKFFAKLDFCNPMGNVQGGFIAAMLDDAAAVACIIKAKTRIVVPTLEFKVSFYAPAKQGILFANGYCRKLGRTVAFLEADLQDEHGKRLATMSATCLPTPMPDNAILTPRTSA
jgi:uncharacterized protein (TIGR00369 family)